MTDQFNGDNANLIASINALLALDASGSLEPHGIGGHARFLLETSASRLQALSHAAGQEAVAEVGRDGSIIWLALRPLKAGIKLYTHPRTCPSGEVEDET